MAVNNRTNSRLKTLEANTSVGTPFMNCRKAEQIGMSKTSPQAMYNKVERNRRKSIDGIKGLFNKFFEPNSEEDEETPNNVRLYYEHKQNTTSNLASTKLSDGLSPIRIEEEAMFPNEIGDYKRQSNVSGTGNINHRTQLSMPGSKKKNSDNALKFLKMFNIAH